MELLPALQQSVVVPAVISYLLLFSQLLHLAELQDVLLLGFLSFFSSLQLLARLYFVRGDRVEVVWKSRSRGGRIVAKVTGAVTVSRYAEMREFRPMACIGYSD